MNAPKLTPSALGKGQLRCFQCKRACPIKDGNWHTHGSQQVFLCKSCEKAQQG